MQFSTNEPNAILSLSAEGSTHYRTQPSHRTIQPGALAKAEYMYLGEGGARRDARPQTDTD